MERVEAIKKLKQLVGKDLHELAHQYNVTIYQNGRVNKGWAGHVCERHLELPINSAQSPNFGSWELKSIPRCSCHKPEKGSARIPKSLEMSTLEDRGGEEAEGFIGALGA